ncbi:MAG TPA: hypothetical protein VFB28_07195 [Terriglobales bacterium]|nr:hypothetical protein [Terriglobales bacterium]
MHYIFVDEAYSRTGSRTKIALASWAVEQVAWTRRVERLAELYKAPVLQSIATMFDRLDVRASICTSDLANTLYRSGEIDGTDDIARMARTDNIWSQCVIYGVGGVIRDLVQAGREIGTVDLYFDPKSLKPEHLEAIKSTLRKLLVQVVKGYANTLDSKLLKKLSIRRIESAEKATSGQTRNKFQAGTWVADKLCTNVDEVGRLNPRRITQYDISDVVRRTAQQFDGIPF